MSEEYELVLSANYGSIPSYLWGVVVWMVGLVVWSGGSVVIMWI